MSKDRLVAFTDAVIAIIMTILVLELQKPASMTWSAVWDLRMNFFAYTISFFWIGTMWVNMHRAWDRIEKINNKLVWISMLLLFSLLFSLTRPALLQRILIVLLLRDFMDWSFYWFLLPMSGCTEN